jgi:hypothetical protein
MIPDEWHSRAQREGGDIYSHVLSLAKRLGRWAIHHEFPRFQNDRVGSGGRNRVCGGVPIEAKRRPASGNRQYKCDANSRNYAVGAAMPESTRGIEDLLDRLQKRQVTPAQLLAFRDSLLNGDPHAVIPAIRAFLATGKDVSTGYAFELGDGGSLERAPTLRLLLLDVLGQLSRKARTADASEVSKEILAGKNSSDEWAIALRNVAWHEPQSQGFLAAKFSEMIRYEPWRSQPSTGFLEAFDVAVYSRQVAVMEPLDEMLGNPVSELQRAAAVALDRLAESAPLEVMQKLNSQPQMFADHPFLRADWFAKAILVNPCSAPPSRPILPGLTSRWRRKRKH